MIAVDEWHEMNAAKEKEQEVDEPHISEDLRPSFSEGEYRKADRPRTRELNNFGVVSSLTGREKVHHDFSREATHFSDKIANRYNRLGSVLVCVSYTFGYKFSV